MFNFDNDKSKNILKNKEEEMKKYCEAMNSFGIWGKVCLWHDGTGNNYPQETWEEFVDYFKNGETVWKAIRIVSSNGGSKRIIKTKYNHSLNTL